MYIHIEQVFKMYEENLTVLKLKIFTKIKHF